MDVNQRKEQFSKAYLRAVASVAGFTVYEPEVDDDSIDMGLAATGGAGSIRSPRLELQLKCTSQEVLHEDGVHFPLSIKNYDDLRADDVLVPRILVVVRVPQFLTEWLAHSEEQLLMRRCGYYVSLRGRPAVENQESVTVTLPRENMLTVETLTALMNSVAEGDEA
jgi:hypothetical protein